jgi:hypothetical protein
MHNKEVKDAAKTIKKRLKEKDLWIETRSQGEDVHILVGKRDGTANKVHVVIDGKTAEIRVEDNQAAPQEIIKSIESTLALNDGRIVRFSRELLELEKRPWEDNVDGFSAHIVQIGGPGSRVLTKTAWLLSEHGYLNADKFVSVGFTSGGDMIVGTKGNFTIVSRNSPSGNAINDAGMPRSCSLFLEDKLKNEVIITCKRTSEDDQGTSNHGIHRIAFRSR